MPSAAVRCTALLTAVAALVAPPCAHPGTALHLSAQNLGTTTAPVLSDEDTARAITSMRADARLASTTHVSSLTDDELIWFARDRRGDATEAADKAAAYMRWRRDRGGLGADREALLKRAAPEAKRRVGYLAREKDALNRPTVIVVARRHQALTRDLKASQALCVAVLEDAINEAQKNGGEQVLALVDLRQVGPQNVDVEFLIWLVMTMRSYFPKRSGPARKSKHHGAFVATPAPWRGGVGLPPLDPVPDALVDLRTGWGKSPSWTRRQFYSRPPGI
jgi:hypothetical protein